MLRHIISSLLMTTVSGVVGLQLPALTGHYPVGTVTIDLIDNTRNNDPFGPGDARPRTLPVSVYYPTTNTAVKCGNYSVAPYFPSPTTAAGLNSYVGNSTELLNITTRSYYKAPIASTDFPVLIFSHGFGGSRFMYPAHLENLASRGWIIFAPDHPYDAMITEFPYGDVARMNATVLAEFPTSMPGAIAARVADVGFIANVLKNSSSALSQVPGLTTSKGQHMGILNSTSIGIYGHSLGGATAAQAVANLSVFPCGANFDGGIYGPVAETGLDKPFLLIEAADHPNSTDTTFAGLWNRLRGFRREFLVNGTVHPAFMDTPLLRDLLGEQFPAGLLNQTGTVPGKRLLDVDTALIDSFFSFCLKGASAEKLDRLPREFPELSVPGQAGEASPSPPGLYHKISTSRR